MAASIGGLSSALSVAAPARPSGDPGAAPALAPAAPPGAATTAFAAFPSSYSGFGNDGKGFGQIGVTNGALGVVTNAAPAADPPGATASATTAPAKDPPPADPPSDPYPFDPQTGIARVATLGDLAQVNERIAISNAQGQPAAAAQLQPIATQLDAKLNYQLFAGLGTTPAQPFAQPEIPHIFLNVPA